MPSPARCSNRRRLPARSASSASSRPTRSARPPAPQDLTLRHRVSGLSRRRSRAPLSALAARGGLLRQLWLSAARPSRSDASANAAHALEPRRARLRRGSCSRSSASTAPRTRAWSTSTLRTARSPIGSAARPTQPPGCSTRCIIAGCCGSRAATRGTRVYARARERIAEPAAAGDGRSPVNAAHRRAGRRDRAQICTASRREPRQLLRHLTRRRAAMGATPRGGARARQAAPRPRPRSRASTGTGPPRKRPARRRWRSDEGGAAAHAVRSGRLGSAPLRDLLGLAVSLRGLYARAETQARLLRAAAAVARARDRLGQSHRTRRARCGAPSATSPAAPPRERRLPRRPSRRSSSACAFLP